MLAWSAAVTGSLALAEERAAVALKHTDRRGWVYQEATGHARLATAFVSYLRVDDDGVRRSLCAAEQALGSGADPAARFVALVLHLLADIDGPSAGEPGDRRGRVAALRTACSAYTCPLEPAAVAFVASAVQRTCLDVGEHGWADESVDWATDRLGRTAETELLAAVARLHRGRPDVARRVVGTVVDGEVLGVSPLTLIEAWLLEAVLTDAADRSVRSHLALSRAIRLAEPDGVVRPFRNGGRAVRALLTRHSGRFGRAEPFVHRVLAGAPTTGFGPTERLSEREMEILLELPSLRTAEEMAVDLGVSVNTVKTHMRAVYRKLQVGTRRDAVAAGRRHALL
jgi:LuxR family maltose regulon positive regulatory protein